MNILFIMLLLTIFFTAITITLFMLFNKFKKEFIRNIGIIFTGITIVFGIISLCMTNNIKTEATSKYEYNEFVTISEEFDMVCSNQETATFELKKRVYNEAEQINETIKTAKAHKGKIDEIFYNKLFFDAPEIILGKLK